MDAAQLNRINELAREYLRHGIAKSTTDAVEKARFQLSMEQKQKDTENPYESLFTSMAPKPRENTMKIEITDADSREAAQNTTAREDSEGSGEYQSRKTAAMIRELEEKYNGIIESHSNKVNALESEIAMLKSEIRAMKQGAAYHASQTGSAGEQPQKSPESPVVAPVQGSQSTLPQENNMITKAIEQTIKGRTISAEDVSVDKIFYFGNR